MAFSSRSALAVVMLSFLAAYASALNTVTVTSCSQLSTALASTTVDDIVIPAGTSIDVTTCPSALPAIARTVTIRGGGSPFPTITGKNSRGLLKFVGTGSGSGYSFNIVNLTLANGYYDPTSTSWGAGCIWCGYNSKATGTLSGVTITGCTGNGGGAVLMDYLSGSLTVQSCTFSNNTATGGNDKQGSAITSASQWQAPLYIYNSVFMGNKATAPTTSNSVYGGAVYADGSVFIYNSNFTSNAAVSVVGHAWGGAVHAGGNASLVNCIFSGNIATTARSALAYGGAVYNGNYILNATGCTFTFNSAFSPPSSADVSIYGGAVYTGTALISGSTFSSNSASSTTSYAYGAAIFASTAQVSSSTFTANTVSAGSYGGGGAIHAGSGANCSGSSFTGNSVSAVSTGAGGAINSGSGQGVFNLTQCTFTSNSARGSPALGGAFAATWDTVLTNCAFSNNYVAGVSGDAQGGAIRIQYYSATVSGSTFTGNFAYGTATPNSGGASGGALHSTFAYITNSNFQSNGALSTVYYAVGGAIQVENSITTSNTIFTNNSAVAGGVQPAYGGAVRIYYGNSPFSFNTTTFTNNQATGPSALGGAIYSVGVNVNVSLSTFSSNSATSTSTNAGGGGIYSDGTVLVTSSVFNQNVAQRTSSIVSDDGAAGGALQAAYATIWGSSFSLNAANSNSTNTAGGAVFSTGSVTISSSSFITNSVLAPSNKEASGGAACVLYNYYRPASFTSLQFNSNSAKGGKAQGGAVYAAGFSYVTKCTFASNSAYSTSTSTDYAQARGGGFYQDLRYNTADTNITGSTFTSNSASGIYAVGGGALAGSTIYDTGSMYSSNLAALRPFTCPASNPTCLSPVAEAGAILATNSLTETGSLFTGNAASSAQTDGAGGAISVNYAAITSCTFTSNRAVSGCTMSCTSTYGGGAVFSNGNMAISASTFNTNSHTSSSRSAGAVGGAIQFGANSYSAGALTVASSSFTGNTAVGLVNGSSAAGGAISCGIANWWSVGTIITSSNFTANVASAYQARGGAIANAGILNISTSSFSRNVANGTAGSGGGAVTVSSGTAVFASSSFTFNTVLGWASTAGGGAIDFRQSTDPANISACAFTLNSATASGSAVGGALAYGTSYNSRSIVSATFTNNSASSPGASGGAVSVAGSTLLVGTSSFDGGLAVGSGAVGGAVAATSGTPLLFCRGNTFGRALSNTVRNSTAGAAAKNDVDTGGGVARFCPSITAFNAVGSNYYAILDCNGCDCASLNPCDASATCLLTASNVPYCKCTAGGIGFTCSASGC